MRRSQSTRSFTVASATAQGALTQRSRSAGPALASPSDSIIERARAAGKAAAAASFRIQAYPPSDLFRTFLQEIRSSGQLALVQQAILSGWSDVMTDRWRALGRRQADVSFGFAAASRGVDPAHPHVTSWQQAYVAGQTSAVHLRTPATFTNGNAGPAVNGHRPEGLHSAQPSVTNGTVPEENRSLQRGRRAEPGRNGVSVDRRSMNRNIRLEIVVSDPGSSGSE